MANKRKWPRGPYAYLFCYPDGTPYYVGVGKGDRARKVARNRWANHIDAKIRASGRTTLRVVVECFTRDEACSLEKKWIKEHGRRHRDGGLLVNITDGGEGAPGMVWTEEMRGKVSRALKGRRRAPEVCAQLSKSLRGNKNALGLKHSEETRARMSVSLRGKKLNLSDEERAKRAARASERNRLNNPARGVPKTLEHRAKISASRREYLARTSRN